MSYLMSPGGRILSSAEFSPSWIYPKVNNLRSSPHLKHVAIVRAHVSQLGLLVVCNPNVVRLLPLAILSQTCEVVDDAAGSTQADEGEAYTVAFVEERLRISRLEAVTGNDTADLQELSVHILKGCI